MPSTFSDKKEKQNEASKGESAKAAFFAAQLLGISSYALISSPSVSSLQGKAKSLQLWASSNLSLKKIKDILEERRKKFLSLPDWEILPCTYRGQKIGDFIFKKPSKALSEPLSRIIPLYLGLSIQTTIMEQRLARISLLQEISQSLSSSKRFEAGIEISRHILESLLGTPYIYFAFTEKEKFSRALLSKQHAHSPPASMHKKFLPRLIKKEEVKKQAHQFKLKGWEECREILALPLQSQGFPWGWLFIGHLREKFSEEDQKLLHTLSYLLSTSLERLKLYEELSEQSIRDSLTGLHNHRFFQESLSQEVARLQRYGTIFSLALFDIDYFKRINDSYGHFSGDRVLLLFSELMKASFREIDVLARYGGEEFAVILPNTPLLGAFIACDRFREKVEKKSFGKIKGSTISLTTSCGIAMAPLHGQEKNILIQKSDKALYRAKKEGRNRTCLA